jgi:MFS family permease
MIILGIGVGMAMNPLLLAAMSDVKPEESGLASGVVNTSFMMGGALGLAVLASVAAAQSGDDPTLSALTSGYHTAFLVGTAFALAAGTVAAVFMRDAQMPAHAHEEVLHAA